MANKTKAGTASEKKGAKKDGVGGSKVALGTLSAGALVGALAAGVYGLLKLGKGRYTDGQPMAPGPQPASAGTPETAPKRAAKAGGDHSFGSGEHSPKDLMGDHHPTAGERAPEAFRPDATASVPEGERDALRPALAGEAAPTMVKGQSRGKARIDAAPS